MTVSPKYDLNEGIPLKASFVVIDRTSLWITMCCILNLVKFVRFCSLYDIYKHGYYCYYAAFAVIFNQADTAK